MTSSEFRIGCCITFDYKEKKNFNINQLFKGFRLVGGVTKNGDRTARF